MINPYHDGAVEETDVMLQKELSELGANEELKVQFKKRYQLFWLQKDIHTRCVRKVTRLVL